MHMEDRHLTLIKSILSKYDYVFYAFGSRVLGKAKKFSDLDLCFFEAIPLKERLELEEEFEESDLPFTIDLVDFHSCDQDFQKVMMRDMECFQTSDKLSKIEHNALGHFKYLPEVAGFNIKVNGGLTIINCGLGSSMFNIVYGVCNDIRGVMSEFKGQPFAWWVPPSALSNELSHRLGDIGFVAVAPEYAMLCDLDHIQNVEVDFEVLPVSKIIQLEHFIEVLEPYDSSVRHFYETLDESMLCGQETLCVGYEKQLPVVIGTLYVEQDAAGVFNVLTREDKRGCGYGTGMMKHLMKAAKESGVRYVTLSASSDSGYRIYERLGFRSLGRFRCFEWVSQ